MVAQPTQDVTSPAESAALSLSVECQARLASGETVLVLRTTPANRRSWQGTFLWPEAGLVECKDWQPTPECGHGLHGWKWGAGDGRLGDWSETALWLVVEVIAADVIDLTDGGSVKCKFPRGVVVFCGDRKTAVEIVSAWAPAGTPVIAGTATAGYAGTATAGTRGTATAGDAGTATAGEVGVIAVRWYDDKKNRYRVAMAYVGEDGIRAGVAYCVRDGKLVARDEVQS